MTKEDEVKINTLVATHVFKSKEVKDYYNSFELAASVIEKMVEKGSVIFGVNRSYTGNYWAYFRKREITCKSCSSYTHTNEGEAIRTSFPAAVACAALRALKVYYPTQSDEPDFE